MWTPWMGARFNLSPGDMYHMTISRVIFLHDILQLEE
jgi:hypothetical protein